MISVAWKLGTTGVGTVGDPKKTVLKTHSIPFANFLERREISCFGRDITGTKVTIPKTVSGSCPGDAFCN
jgi:hypothetical protein